MFESFESKVPIVPNILLDENGGRRKGHAARTIRCAKISLDGFERVLSEYFRRHAGSFLTDKKKDSLLRSKESKSCFVCKD